MASHNALLLITRLSTNRHKVRLNSFRILTAIVTCSLISGAAAHAHSSTASPANAPEADCSRKAIAFYASIAPGKFHIEKKGLLFGVRTHTDATAVNDMPGYNSCALVVHAILQKAGCHWARRTANAKAIYDMAYREGWRPSSTPTGGCLVAWNSQAEGNLPRIGRGVHVDPMQKSGVLFRHVGLMTSSWWSVDNTSFLSRPSGGISLRPFRYQSPMYLCPPYRD
ncbi:MAG: hypothetical protein AB7V46_22865 [Thermomicrobiales bacterium]